jgi:hypothetical protein
MARQVAGGFITGKMGDLTYYKRGDNYYVRACRTDFGNQVKTKPQFIRTRENAEEFGSVIKYASSFRGVLRRKIRFYQSPQSVARFNKICFELLRKDGVHVRGKRLPDSNYIQWNPFAETQSNAMDNGNLASSPGGAGVLIGQEFINFGLSSPIRFGHTGLPYGGGSLTSKLSWKQKSGTNLLVTKHYGLWVPGDYLYAATSSVSENIVAFRLWQSVLFQEPWGLWWGDIQELGIGSIEDSEFNLAAQVGVERPKYIGSDGLEYWVNAVRVIGIEFGTYEWQNGVVVFNPNGYQKYGCCMIDKFIRASPTSVPIINAPNPEN